jgi:hypothetical protein
VQVEFNDFAFEGLGGALQLGQVDAAIAAASVTSKEPGQYTAVWNLVNTQNVPFGESLRVAVTRTLTHASSRNSCKMRLSGKKITEDLIDRMMGWRHSAFNELRTTHPIMRPP